MSAFQRKLDILQFIPRAPRKVSTRQIFEALRNHGHDNIDMRTIQRDLVSLENIGLFGLEVDKRSKPYGWFINANFKKLNINFMDGNTALAFKVLERSEGSLPTTTLRELQPYFEKATQILNVDSNSLLTNWLRVVTNEHVFEPFLPPEIDAPSFENLKNAIFSKKQVSADIKRLFSGSKEMVWKHYDRVNPMGLIKQDGRYIFICSFGLLHKKSYALPLQFIKNVKVLDSPCQQSIESVETIQNKITLGQSEVKLKLLVCHSSLFLLQGYKLSEDQTVSSFSPDKSLCPLPLN